MKTKVLFVCTGNTCRSPMAEALFRRRVEELELAERFTVASAGLAALDGDAAADGARCAMAERGLDLKGHRARPVSQAVVRRADVILTMTVAQRERLQEEFPGAAHRVYTIKEYAGDERGSPDVRDPFGQDDERYREVARELEGLIERVLDRWERQAGTERGAAANGERKGEPDAGRDR